MYPPLAAQCSAATHDKNLTMKASSWSCLGVLSVTTRSATEERAR